MTEVLNFLNNAGVYFLATTEGDQARVRPIGFVMDCDGRLYFCTGNNKAMSKQMAANPKVEIACYDGAGNTLRITGKAVFATTEALQKKAIEVMPSLSSLYAPGDGIFEVYYIDQAKAVCSDMAGASRELAI